MEIYFLWGYSFKLSPEASYFEFAEIDSAS